MEAAYCETINDVVIYSHREILFEIYRKLR